MNSFIYKPTTGSEVLKAAPPGTKLFLYSDLCKLGVDEVLNRLDLNNIILYQDPRNMKSGHWVSLSFHPKRRKAYFFSSYGGRPDEEKNRWLSPNSLYQSGQSANIINDILKELYLSGWEIHYNDYPFQHEGDRTATCGVWATAFLNSRLNPEEFEEQHLPLEYYYGKYF